MFRSDEKGLSLVETLAALTIFAVITVGITPLLASSLRGSTLSRAYTIGKDVGVEAMERARGLPYYISYQSQTKKVDVLDIYFPCADPTLASTGCAGEGIRTYDAAQSVFSITCTPSTTVGPTCSRPLPAGYSVTYASRFVTPDAASVVAPAGTYKRNPNFAGGEGQLDTPPSQLLEMTITTSWLTAGDAKSYQLNTVIGDRKFGDVKMAAAGRINHGVQVLTAFVHTAGDSNRSDLKAIAGSAESRVETRLVATATERIRAVEVTLNRRATDLAPEAPALATPLTGVITEFRAPPNQTPTVLASPTADQTMQHPNLSSIDKGVAKIAPTSVSGLSTAVTNELPSAAGAFSFSSASSGTDGYLWVQNQADTTNDALLHLDAFRKVLSLRSGGSSGTPLNGSTAVTTTAVGAGRKVESTATVKVPLLRLLPATHLTTGDDKERFVIVIRDFTATVTCTTVGSTSSVPSGAWTATLKSWYDADNDLLASPVPFEVPLSGTIAAGNPDLRTILSASPYTLPPYNFVNGNPLVYDGLTPATDVYLFDDTLQKGYMTNFRIKPVAVTEDATGTLTTAAIDGAIQMTTAPTNVLFPESGMNVSVGSLTCEALDKR